MSSIFYSVEKLDLNKKQEIVKEAFSLNTSWWVDHLDAAISFRRKKVEMDFETILSKLSQDSHFTVILRTDFIKSSLYGEVGFVTKDHYFLWVLLKDEDLYKLTQKFNLNRV